MRTSVRLEQREKAHLPISVTDGGDGDVREAGATMESTAPNLRHRWGDDGALAPTYQRITLRTNNGIAVLSRIIDLVVLGNGDASEAGATRESPSSNLRHRWGDGDARETGAIRESPLPNLCHRWGDDGALAPTYQRITLRTDYGIAVLSGVIDLVVFGNGDAREAGTIKESIFPNHRHRWGDGDARETGAARESIFPNLRHRFWYGDARDAGATRESIFPNLHHRLGDDGVLTSSYQCITFRMYYSIAILP